MTLLLCLLLPSFHAVQAISPPSLLQPQPSVDSGQGNPQILCQVLGSPASAHVLSWYQQLPGRGPTFLLSQREGAAPTYGPGVTPRFLAELDSEKSSARLTVGNAGPGDVGIYYCALWHAGQYIFGEGTWLLSRDERLRPPQLTLLTAGPGSPLLCVAVGHHPAPLRLSWSLESQLLSGAVGESLVEDAGNLAISMLQRPPVGGTRGAMVTCKAYHQSGTSAATLRLQKQEARCFGLPVQLERTLIFALYCYLGLLGGAALLGLLLFVLLAARRRPALSSGFHVPRRSRGGPSFQTCSSGRLTC